VTPPTEGVPVSWQPDPSPGAAGPGLTGLCACAPQSLSQASQMPRLCLQPGLQCVLHLFALQQPAPLSTSTQPSHLHSQVHVFFLIGGGTSHLLNPAHRCWQVSKPAQANRLCGLLEYLQRLFCLTPGVTRNEAGRSILPHMSWHVPSRTSSD
jgi:hypothetical protein